MSVRAKFVCKSVEHHEGNVRTVRLEPVIYDDCDENKAFWKYTPSGTMSMSITNPAAFEQFEPGVEYYLDFTKVA